MRLTNLALSVAMLLGGGFVGGSTILAQQDESDEVQVEGEIGDTSIGVDVDRNQRSDNEQATDDDRENARDRQRDGTQRRVDRQRDARDAEPTRQSQRRQQQQRDRQVAQMGLQLEDNGNQLVISEVRDGSLAARSDFRARDVIVNVDGRTVRTPAQFRRVLTTYEQQRIPVTIRRNNRERTIYITLQSDAPYRGDDYWRDPIFDDQQAWLGVTLDPRYEDYAVVRRVYADSPADRGGVKMGDWILAVEGREVRSSDHLARIIQNMEPRQRVNVEVARRVRRSLDVQLGDTPQRVLRPRPDDRTARRYYDDYRDRIEWDDRVYRQDDRVYRQDDGVYRERDDRNLRERFRDRIQEGARELGDRVDREIIDED